MSEYHHEGHHTKTIAPYDMLHHPTACCCGRCSWYLTDAWAFYPNCFGFAFRGIFLCMDFSITGEFFHPSVWCKIEKTALCCDVRASFPTDEDVPCAIGILGHLIWEKTPGMWASKSPKTITSTLNPFNAYQALN
jgi:hypothetical protein